jgi:hypothetical protein
MYSLPGLGLTDAAATAGLKAFRQAMLALPRTAQHSPIVRAAFDRVSDVTPAHA